MKYTVKVTAQFKKDYKRAKKRGLPINLLDDLIKKLAHGEPIAEKNDDHPLTGNYARFRECHIAPDWLLIYLLDKDILVLTLTRTGSHGDLF
ncbi:MAG TPA: type II toxin-antitoxin system YafQ family toxin [Clostridia bacterium]|nr:type II toxin-antitoxin system YafQ family toxin [Clostridia bacterium]